MVSTLEGGLSMLLHQSSENKNLRRLYNTEEATFPEPLPVVGEQEMGGLR